MFDITGKEILIGQSVVKSPCKPRAIYLVIGEKDSATIVMKRVRNKENFPDFGSKTRIIAPVKEASIEIIATLPEPRVYGQPQIKMELKTIQELKKDKITYSKYIVSEFELLSSKFEQLKNESTEIDIPKKLDLERKWRLLEQYLGIKVKTPI